jgi:hypothetical protein
MQLRRTGKRREKMAQLVSEDERPLPALASLKASVRDGLIDFSPADSGKSAGLRNREAFAFHSLRGHIQFSVSVREQFHECGRSIAVEQVVVSRQWPEMTGNQLPAISGDALS